MRLTLRLVVEEADELVAAMGAEVLAEALLAVLPAGKLLRKRRDSNYRAWKLSRFK